MSFLTRLKNEKWLTFFAAFLLPSIILGVVFALADVYPFGNRTILHIDMYHQYAPFFMELLDKLKSGGSPMYSWNIGVGSDFVATYAYYLASPLNLFLLFTAREHLLEFMTVLVLIKTGFSGLSFAAYARGHFGTKSAVVLLPSVLYALSGYAAAYYWDIMWLDCVALFPLVLLGMERLVKYGKCGLYAVTLALSIWSNYYISIMICIFLVLWYALTLSELQKTVAGRVKSFGRMLLYSVLAAGISAVLILPEIRILGISGSGNNTFPEEVTWYFRAVDEAAQHLALMPVTTTEGELPNIFCGAAAVFFVILYFLNRRISLSQKLKRAALLLFFLISFNLNVLDFFWHGLHFPEGLPARQSFLYIFLVLILGLEALLKADGNRYSDLIIAGALNVLLYVWIFASGKAEEKNLALTVTALLLLCEIALYLIGHRDRVYLKKTAFLLALAAVVFEGAVNFSETGLSTTNRDSYIGDLKAYRTLTAEQMEKDGTFFRTEKFERMMKDENCLSGYPAATLFSSLINYDVALAYKSAGMEGGRNFYCYNGATPILSAMLSVKYLMTDSPDESSPYRTLVAEQDGVYLYENTYTLPLGFLTAPELDEAWDRDGQGNRIEVVNRLGHILGAAADTLSYQGAMEKKDGDAVFTAAADGYYYAVHTTSGVQSMKVSVGERETTLSKTTHNYFLDLGYLAAGQEVHIHASNDAEITANVYRLEQSAVEEAYRTLSRHTMEELAVSDTRVSGRINVPEESDLILTIPAEPGWSARVDGKGAETQTFMDAWIRLPLAAGTHEIELTYRTPWIVPGALISVACIVLLVLLLCVAGRKGKTDGSISEY